MLMIQFLPSVMLLAVVSCMVQEVDSAEYYSQADPIVPFGGDEGKVDPMMVEETDAMVKVQFYGESQCPFCRKFVTETWNDIWKDAELKAHIDYEYVPWGNSYFGTAACGTGPYNPQERQCFYDHCITNRVLLSHDEDTDDDCFKGEPVYQHSPKEGQVDIYESCILVQNGLDQGVAFTYCAEGDLMDDTEMSAHELLMECAADANIDVAAIQSCLESQGRQMEIANAKKTPPHSGVPFVLVDGKPLEDPFTETKPTICKVLLDKGVTSLPKACTAAATTTAMGGNA